MYVANIIHYLGQEPWQMVVNFRLVKFQVFRGKMNFDIWNEVTMIRNNQSYDTLGIGE
jgi:hypothetical protein